ncbi:MAG: bifunctional phosphoribosyl-AMP cyclohydrolase/phosphoribosyl-ATP diphosphatase HisIE [Saprospiraceae bacterium]|nr:bifunctional phosphoribosyl-AMP cyclohydrolase/phosphoribosyl-ATP diphosphatase HisIE [Saprospiraceae bacterium]
MINIKDINFEKSDGLVPVIAQDAKTGVVLMMGYANEEAISRSISSRKLTFFSRSRNVLWTKGESSGHYLYIEELLLDCDADTVLAKVQPVGPVCHTGKDTCWGEKNDAKKADFLKTLSAVIESRKNEEPDSNSYVNQLFRKGVNKVSQKFGEEAIELLIEAKDDNDERFLNEAADLLFHYMILLSQRGYTLDDVSEILSDRHNKS